MNSFKPGAESSAWKIQITARLAMVAALSFLFVSPLSMAATSVSQHGFTWTFSSDRPVGQYCNGDWWVVGPVTITGITPTSATDGNGWTKNGTVVNPPVGGGQGFDSSMNGFLGVYYAPDWNVAPSLKGPLTVATGSVVSSISRSTPGTAATRPQITDAAVLTVVSSAPAAGSFRPPLAGSDKTSYWNKNQLNYGILKKLLPVSDTPALSTVEGYFVRPWFAHMEGSPARYIAPLNNMPEYGRDQAQMLSLGLLSLHLNYSDAQKEKLYIRLVQCGIDVFGAVKNGMVYLDYGGLNCGRKAPLVLAALALNDANMKVYADAAQKFIFQDDRQIWIVTQSDIGREIYPKEQDGRVREPYTQAHVGLPEWGSQHTKNNKWDGSNWDVFYRHINGGPLAAHSLFAILLEGGRAAWNWEPFFLYHDRFWSIEGQNGYTGQKEGAPNNINKFAFNMWKAYRGTLSIPPPTPGPSSPQGLKVVNP